MVLNGIKVKIKTNNDSLSTKSNLLKICFNQDIKVTSAWNTSGNFFVKLENHVDADKLFSIQVLSLLENSSFYPVLPPEIRVNRTIFVRNLDTDIVSESKEAIIQELSKCNNWCSVTDVVTFSRSHCMKVTFSDTSMTEKALQIGLFMFHMHIPCFNISRDIYIHILRCYSCFAIDNHATHECPKKLENPNFKLCSNCSNPSHERSSCTARPEDFKCVNCHENHHSLAMKCPIRRKIIFDKRKCTESPNTASVLKKSMTNKIPNIDATTVNKTISITVLALFTNHSTPGSFEKTFNSLMQDNGLPKINLQNYSPPKIDLPSINPQPTREVIDPEIRLDDSVSVIPERMEPNQSTRFANQQTASLPTTVPSASREKSKWDDFKFFKLSGTKISNNAEIVSCWENGSLVILGAENRVPDLDFLIKCSRVCKFPKFDIVSKAKFNQLTLLSNRKDK